MNEQKNVAGRHHRKASPGDSRMTKLLRRISAPSPAPGVGEYLRTENKTGMPAAEIARIKALRDLYVTAALRACARCDRTWSDLLASGCNSVGCRVVEQPVSTEEAA